jgi:Ketopantoate reductase PanE/ApbA C terminal
MNGLPWWYFYKERGPLDGHHLESVDPGVAQWNAIGPERTIGCVVGHKISMLQDLERGRPLEIDALVSAVQEMGRLVKSQHPRSTRYLRWCRNVAARLDSAGQSRLTGVGSAEKRDGSAQRFGVNAAIRGAMAMVE